MVFHTQTFYTWAMMILHIILQIHFLDRSLVNLEDKMFIMVVILQIKQRYIIFRVKYWSYKSMKSQMWCYIWLVTEDRSSYSLMTSPICMLRNFKRQLNQCSFKTYLSLLIVNLEAIWWPPGWSSRKIFIHWLQLQIWMIRVSQFIVHQMKLLMGSILKPAWGKCFQVI